jgi:hypothetical protein
VKKYPEEKNGRRNGKDISKKNCSSGMSSIDSANLRIEEKSRRIVYDDEH